MATFLSSLQTKVKQAFRKDSLSWFDRSYVVDWSIATAAWFIAVYIKTLPPFEREFDRSDPIIDYKHKKSQISGELNGMIALFVPLALCAAISLLRGSALDIHHSCLALWAGRASSEVITECLKNRVGRLRPDFLARCKWDKSIKACAGKVDDILDGRRSFPSGHSSTAFYGMTFLTLWIAGVTGAWCLSHPMPARSFLASRLARLTLSILPVVFATWVAVSRLEDNRHHKEDVIAGSLIGIGSATICYLAYWPNPFSKKTQLSTFHAKRVYGSTEEMNGYDYELAGMVHANEVESV